MYRTALLVMAACLATADAAQAQHRTRAAATAPRVTAWGYAQRGGAVWSRVGKASQIGRAYGRQSIGWTDRARGLVGVQRHAYHVGRADAKLAPGTKVMRPAWRKIYFQRYGIDGRHMWDSNYRRGWNSVHGGKPAPRPARAAAADYLGPLKGQGTAIPMNARRSIWRPGGN